MKTFAERRKDRVLKAIEKRRKIEDFYNIDKMSDVEFLRNYSDIRKRAIWRTIIGSLLFIAALVVLAIFWDKIFWSG